MLTKEELLKILSFNNQKYAEAMEKEEVKLIIEV